MCLLACKSGANGLGWTGAGRVTSSYFDKDRASRKTVIVEWRRWRRSLPSLLLLLLEEELDEDDNEGEGGESAVVAVRIALVAFLLWVRGFTAR